MLSRGTFSSYSMYILTFCEVLSFQNDLLLCCAAGGGSFFRLTHTENGHLCPFLCPFFEVPPRTKFFPLPEAFRGVKNRRLLLLCYI